jgi:hypothetical protein
MRRLPTSARRAPAPARRSVVAADADPLAFALPRRHRAPDPALVPGLQRAVGNAATGRLLRKYRPASEQRDQKEEERRDERRGRTRRRDDPFGAFESDWVGRALLSHYLYGGGEKVEIRHSPSWTAYMTASERLREQNQEKVLDMAAELLTRGKAGSQPTYRTYHAEVENGEGIVGYQYLHGTNKTVGDFEIVGRGTVLGVEREGVASVPGRNPYAPDVTTHGAGRRVDLELIYVWNDIIDPNGSYISDDVKSAIAELISLGDAEGFTISIGWRDTCTVFVSEKGDFQIVGGYPTE